MPFHCSHCCDHPRCLLLLPSSVWLMMMLLITIYATAAHQRCVGVLVWVEILACQQYKCLPHAPPRLQLATLTFCCLEKKTLSFWRFFSICDFLLSPWPMSLVIRFNCLKHENPISIFGSRELAFNSHSHSLSSAAFSMQFNSVHLARQSLP